MKYTEEDRAVPLEISDEDDEEVKNDGNDDYNNFIDDKNDNDDSKSESNPNRKRNLKATAKKLMNKLNQE
jgi:hypothetical protein